jgi:hypothetical protein
MTTSDVGAGDSAHIPCPACGAPFAPGVTACSRCGLQLVGPAAVALWQVDQELARLNARRSTLITALRPGAVPSDVDLAAVDLAAVETTAVPVSPTQAVRAPAPTEGPGDTWRSPEPRPHEPGASAQQVLLLLGVGLLFVAAVVFVAVAWKSIGIYGQFALIVLAVGAFAWGSVLCSARALSASAEAFAALAGSVAVIGLVGAHRLDFASLGTVPPWTYTGLCAAFLAALAAVGHSVAPRVRTYPLVGLLGVWLAAVTLVGAWDEARLAAGLVAGWLALASPLTAWARRGAEHHATAVPEDFRSALRWPVALLSAVLGLLLGTYVLAAGVFDGVDLLVAGGAVLVVLLLLGYSWSAHRPLASLGADAVPYAAALWVVAGAEVAAASRNADEPALVVVAVVALVGVVLLLVVRGPRTQSWSPQAGLALAGAGVAASLLVLIDGSEASSALALALLALGSLAVAVAEPRWRALALLVSILAAFGALGYALASLDADSTRASAVFTVCALLLAVVTFARIGCSLEEEAVTAGTTLLAFLVAFTLAAEALTTDAAGPSSPPERFIDPVHLITAVMALASLVVLAYALFRPRGPVAAAGAALAVATVWTTLAQDDVRLVEAYTLSAALVCLVVGLVAHVRDSSQSSWITLGPAVALALLPSAVLVNETGSAARIVGVIVAGAAVLLVGVQLRLQALVALGAVALGIVMLLQLWVVAEGLPRWVSFGGAGLLLVAAGVRHERNKADLRSASGWLEAMR